MDEKNIEIESAEETEAPAGEAVETVDAAGTESKETSKTEESAEEKADGKVEAYEDFTLPDGFAVDAERMGSLKEFGIKHQLPQDVAQELVTMHAESIESLYEAQQDQWDQTKEQWGKEARELKILHDSEGNADAGIATALKAVEALGGEELKEALDLTGAGSHPAVVTAFFKLGERMQEGSFVLGGDVEQTSTRAQRMYPSMPN